MSSLNKRSVLHNHIRRKYEIRPEIQSTRMLILGSPWSTQQGRYYEGGILSELCSMDAYEGSLGRRTTSIEFFQAEDGIRDLVL